MTAAIIQVRMGSTRLPRKALLPIWEGRGALELLLARVRRSKAIDTLVVATTNLAEDDCLVRLCEEQGVRYFRGDAANVLDRYYQCAKKFELHGPIVRLTGDCPLHDAEVIDGVIERFLQGGCDYVANTHPPTYPDGLDVEVFSFVALEKAWYGAKLGAEKEHVTYYIYTHPDQFRLDNVEYSEDLSEHRWTLDEPEDLDFIRAVYAELGGQGGGFGMQAVLSLLASRPELAELNRHIGRNEGLKKSLETDRKLGKQ